MLCGWKGNRRSGVELAMGHMLNGQREADEHLA